VQRAVVERDRSARGRLAARRIRLHADVRRRHELGVRAQREAPDAAMGVLCFSLEDSPGAPVHHVTLSSSAMPARIDWKLPDGTTLSARTPSPTELRDAAPTLARAYRDPANAVMMGHADDDAFEASDVVEHYEELAQEGGVGF